MGKLFLFTATAICIILSSCSTKDDSSNNNQTNNKTFVVKAISQSDFNASTGEYVGDAKAVTYDAKGRITSYRDCSITYNSNSVIIKDEEEVMYATLNNDGYITEAELYSHDKNEGAEFEEYEATYNEVGQLIEMNTQEYDIFNDIKIPRYESNYIFKWENNCPIKVIITTKDLQNGDIDSYTDTFFYHSKENNMNIYPFTSCSALGHIVEYNTDEIACMFGFFGKFPTNLTKYSEDGAGYNYIFNDDGSISQAMVSIGRYDFWTERYWY